MTNRKDRIIRGCNFIVGIIQANKSDTKIFKTAATRLARLLDDEVAGVEDELSIEEVQKIFEIKNPTP